LGTNSTFSFQRHRLLASLPDFWKKVQHEALSGLGAASATASSLGGSPVNRYLEVLSGSVVTFTLTNIDDAFLLSFSPPYSTKAHSGRPISGLRSHRYREPDGRFCRLRNAASWDSSPGIVAPGLGVLALVNTKCQVNAQATVFGFRNKFSFA
jgi:hypothetical protein